MGLYWWSINRKRDTTEKVEEETSYLRVAWICVGGKGVTGGGGLGKQKTRPNSSSFLHGYYYVSSFQEDTSLQIIIIYPKLGIFVQF